MARLGICRPSSAVLVYPVCRVRIVLCGRCRQHVVELHKIYQTIRTLFAVGSAVDSGCTRRLECFHSFRVFSFHYQRGRQEQSAMFLRISADHLLRQRSARSAHSLALHPVRPTVRRTRGLEKRLLSYRPCVLPRRWCPALGELLAPVTALRGRRSSEVHRFFFR